MASSTRNGDEREEKWLSLLDYIVNAHVHTDDKIFKKSIHKEVDRAWLTQGGPVVHVIYKCVAAVIFF